MKKNLLRRDFLKQGAFAAAAAFVAPARMGTAQVLTGSQTGLGRTSAPRKVVILGGGLAGLSAGYELTRAGHDVKVLEAQERPGGRVLTLRAFDEGLYGDAGAARI